MSTLRLIPNAVAEQSERRARPRLRRLLLVLGVTLLCCITYLAGIWVGSHGVMTCVTTEQGLLVCGPVDQLPAPAEPASVPRDDGSA